ncbi:Adenylyltransferase and sulfurtransferase MOCS3 [Trifolium repens]|nr:Adenylyltransferase and sulfurtransferase MOCS3 [Trifolium repens]
MKSRKFLYSESLPHANAVNLETMKLPSSLYNHNGGPCYRCLFPTPPHRTACQSCAEGGVLGVVSGIIGCLQALEAIKIAASVGEPLSGRMLLFDALSARIRIVC